MAQKMNREQIHHTVVRGDSRHAEWRRTFGEKKCDIIYIDGDHSYEACRDDIQRSEGVLRDGGLFVVHDYAPGQPGVARAVDELLPPPGWGRMVIPENLFSQDIAAIVCQKQPKWLRV